MTKRLQEDGLYIPNIPYNDIKNAILKNITLLKSSSLVV